MFEKINLGSMKNLLLGFRLKSFWKEKKWYKFVMVLNYFFLKEDLIFFILINLNFVYLDMFNIKYG